MQHTISEKPMSRKSGVWGKTIPDIERRPAHTLAKTWLPDTAPAEKIARPILDPTKPTTVTLVSPMRGTSNRVPRKAYALHEIEHYNSELITKN